MRSRLGCDCIDFRRVLLLCLLLGSAQARSLRQKGVTARSLYFVLMFLRPLWLQVAAPCRQLGSQKGARNSSQLCDNTRWDRRSARL